MPFNDLTFWKLVPWENFIVVELSNKLSLEQGIMNNDKHYGKNVYNTSIIWHDIHKEMIRNICISDNKKGDIGKPLTDVKVKQ